MGQARDSSDDKSLSPTSLAIASMSSAAAAVVVHALWEPGTIIGAAVTPVLMTLFAEALRRPAERVTVRTRGGDVHHATIEVERPRRRWRRAVLAGLAAFALGAAGLTVAELVLDRAIADRNAGTTLLDGGAQPSPSPTPGPPSPTAAPTPRDGAAAEPEQRSDPSERSTPTPTPTPTPTVTPPTQPTPVPAAPTPRPRSELPDQVQQE